MIINYQNFSLSLFDNRYQNASHIHIHTIKNPHNISIIYIPLGSSRAGALSKILTSPENLTATTANLRGLEISASLSFIQNYPWQSQFSSNATLPFKETIKKIKKINLILRINKI